MSDKYWLIKWRRMIATKTTKKWHSYDTQKLTCLVHNCIPKDHYCDAPNSKLITGNAPQKCVEWMIEWMSEFTSLKIVMSGGRAGGWLASPASPFPPTACGSTCEAEKLQHGTFQKLWHCLSGLHASSWLFLSYDLEERRNVGDAAENQAVLKTITFY